MREGNNPARDNSELIEGYFAHRVIVPVFIPSLDGYFEHMREILRLCLDSLITTTGPGVGITVVANGCCREVVEELQSYHARRVIDQVHLYARNHGKVNAVLSVARGCYEDLISVADCDVLFRAGWLDAITRLFCKFPECGFAALSPNPRHAWNNTSATILAALARGELACRKVVPDEDLDQFATSVGQPGFFNAEHRRAQLVVRREEDVVCIGGGHFAFTIRREMLHSSPDEPVQSFWGAENRYFDQPPDRLGAWRLSPITAYAWHMGNVPEPWMYQRLQENHTSAAAAPRLSPPGVPRFRRSWVTYCPVGIRRSLTKLIRKSGILMRSARKNGIERDQHRTASNRGHVCAKDY
jgi:hypothetical protein